MQLILDARAQSRPRGRLDQVEVAFCDSLAALDAAYSRGLSHTRSFERLRRRF